MKDWLGGGSYEATASVVIDEARPTSVVTCLCLSLDPNPLFSSRLNPPGLNYSPGSAYLRRWPIFELLVAGAFVLLIWALVSKLSIIRTLARIFTGLLALASAAATVFLFKVGQQAHWTSDGPGMLLIMAGILFCGLLALVFGGLFFSTVRRSS